MSVRRLLLSAFIFTTFLMGCSGGGGGGSTSSSPATPTITWPAPAAITYGTALSSTQLNATANYPGTFAYTPVAGTVLGAGSQKLSAAFTPSDPAKALSGTATNTITVNKATPTITWYAPAAVSLGTALSATQLDATASFGGASVPGTFAYTPASGTVMNTAGSQALSVTFTPTDAANYNSATASVSLSVTGGPPPGAPAYSFKNVKILSGGYIPGVYFHPTLQNLMYARTDIGGIYRWGPNDTQWVPLLDWLSDGFFNGGDAIGLDPTDPNKLYVAVGLYSNSWA